MIELSDIIRLTRQQQRMVQALQQSSEALTFDQIAEAMGYRGDEPGNAVKVQMYKVRKVLPGLPIKSVRGIGARWNG